MPSTAIAQANRQVAMWKACQLAGLDVSPATGTRKMSCPFGEYSHPDGGREAAFRIYASSAFCFACWEYYTPVRLCALVWDVTEDTAAVTLLGKAGITPPGYAELWQHAASAVQIDQNAVAQALKTRCLRQIPGWTVVQYEPVVAQYLARCLGLLPQVRTEEEARQWLDTCTAVMLAATRSTYDADRL